MKTSIIPIGLIWILFLSCKGNQSNFNQESDDSFKYSIDSNGINSEMSKEPFDSIDLMDLKFYCDSVIQIALNDKKNSYKLTYDTFMYSEAKNIWYDYFDSDSLIETINIDYNLSSYSFRFFKYKYLTENSAISVFNRVETLQRILIDGLNKSPNYVFRVDNYLYWFSFRQTVCGPTLIKYLKKIDSIFEKKYSKKSIIKDHTHFQILKNIKDENLLGKWKLKYWSDILENDSENSFELNNKILVINDTSFVFENKEISIIEIRRIELPDAEALIQYIGFEEKSSNIDNNARQIQGSFIWYHIFLKTDFNDSETEKLNSIFQDMYKFRNDFFCVLYDNKIYKLEKI